MSLPSLTLFLSIFQKYFSRGLSDPTASFITKKPLPSITEKTYPCISLRFLISKSKHLVFRAPANTERYVRVYNNLLSVPCDQCLYSSSVHKYYVGLPCLAMTKPPRTCYSGDLTPILGAAQVTRGYAATFVPRHKKNGLIMITKITKTGDKFLAKQPRRRHNVEQYLHRKLACITTP